MNGKLTRKTPLNSTWSQRDISQLAQGLATLLDASLRIPGTKITIGLDPLLGLIPGVGDLISNAIGSTLLLLATKAGVPRIVILRMSLNIFFNTSIGAIPVLGDIFSVWFKSNVKNARLLHQHCQSTAPIATYRDWFYVGGIIIGMVLLIVLLIGTLVWFSWFLFKTMGLVHS